MARENSRSPICLSRGSARTGPAMLNMPSLTNILLRSNAAKTVKTAKTARADETGKNNESRQIRTGTRLAYLVSRYPAVSHTFILREVRRLRALGFEIDIASVNEPDRSNENMTDDEREEAACTYYLKRHGVMGALRAHCEGLCKPSAWFRGLCTAFRLSQWNVKTLALSLCYFTEALMLARWLRKNNQHHLHVHFATAAANIALILKSMQPITLSMTVHGPDEFYDAPGQWLGEKIVAADFIVCISHFARSQLMLLSPTSQWHKFDICQLGVDTQQYQNTLRSHSSVARKQSPITILCVGRLTPAKGQRILLAACQRLLRDGYNFRTVIIGDGPDAEALRSACKELGLEAHVQFTGAQNQTEVRNWYALADIFALPSFAEGIPVVLMEAMACRIPCVSTRITGIPELIHDGKYGLLVTPSDVHALALALAKLIDTPLLRETLGAAGQVRVQTDYNLHLNVARLATIFQRRLENKSCS